MPFAFERALVDCSNKQLDDQLGEPRSIFERVPSNKIAVVSFPHRNL